MYPRVIKHGNEKWALTSKNQQCNFTWWSPIASVCYRRIPMKHFKSCLCKPDFRSVPSSGCWTKKALWRNFQSRSLKSPGSNVAEHGVMTHRMMLHILREDMNLLGFQSALGSMIVSRFPRYRHPKDSQNRWAVADLFCQISEWPEILDMGLEPPELNMGFHKNLLSKRTSGNCHGMVVAPPQMGLVKNSSLLTRKKLNLRLDLEPPQFLVGDRPQLSLLDPFNCGYIH